MNNSIPSAPLGKSLAEEDASRTTWVGRLFAAANSIVRSQGTERRASLRNLATPRDEVGSNVRKHPISTPFSVDGGAEISRMQLLRAELASKWFDSSAHKALAVVSTDTREGKVGLVVGLASACAMAGDRTLLIDADLRRPPVQSILSVESKFGLSSVIAGHCSLHEAVLPANLEGLFILPAGSAISSPEGILTKTKLVDVLEAAGREFDVILIDTPQISLYPETLVVADAVGRVLVTVHRHQTHAFRLRRTASELRGIRAEIVGAVFVKS
jgi:receptor protein-tyrosine kinase